MQQKRVEFPYLMPHSQNTRSVAELVLGEILLLMRNVPQANAESTSWRLE